MSTLRECFSRLCSRPTRFSSIATSSADIKTDSFTAAPGSATQCASGLPRVRRAATGSMFAVKECFPVAGSMLVSGARLQHYFEPLLAALLHSSGRLLGAQPVARWHLPSAPQLIYFPIPAPYLHSTGNLAECVPRFDSTTPAARWRLSMHVWQVPSFGIDSLELVERPTPKPGPGEVLVKIHAVSLNYRDLLMVKGQYNPKLRLPRIPCSDGAGEVAAVGDGVTAWRPGDRVAGIFMQNWLEGPPTPAKVKGALGGDIDGLLAEYVVLKESGLVAVPEHLSFEEA